MSADASSRTNRGAGGLAAFGVLMVLCCAIGPALIGAVAGSMIGGVLGVVAACVLAASVGLALHLRTRRLGKC